MPISGPLDHIPLWALFGATVAIVLLSIEGGYRLGRYRRRHCEDEKEAPVGAIVAATLGLLGFFLAFTFGLAASRFDGRRQVVVEEANAIGTTYLRAGLLPDGHDVKIRMLLGEYVDARLDVVRTGDVAKALRRSEELHRELWQEAETIGTQYPGSIMAGLFVQSLNDTIDVHAKRVLVGLQNRMPGVLWGALYLLTILTMTGVGYYDGLTRSTRSIAILVLALTFSTIILLVADLDRPQEGLLTVSQRAMTDLQEMINNKP